MGENPMDVKSKIDGETAAIVEKIRKMSVPLGERLEEVASISANDWELGKTIACLVREVGDDGLVTVEESPISGVETEITKGMKLDSGYVAPWMATNAERMNADFSDCPVLVTDRHVTLLSEIVPLMDKLAKKGKKEMLIVADGIDGEALAAVFLNAQHGTFRAAAIRASGIGDHRKKESLRDICAATGATLISDETGKALKDVTPELLGNARKVTVGRETTLIVGGSGKQEEIDKRIGAIKAELETTKSDYDQTKLKERLARLTGSAGVIKVGGTNDVEIKERKHRVEDAVHAVRAAQAEGIVVGGGIALLNASVDADVLRDALRVPLRTIAENAGKNADVILENCLKFPGMPLITGANNGYNAATDTYEDLFAAGVIDPAKVTRIALENAASVAGLLLITEVSIVIEPEKK
jgi:chaperonin GroEL